MNANLQLYRLLVASLEKNCIALKVFTYFENLLDSVILLDSINVFPPFENT
jgi:hypothetical protein